MKKFLCYDTNDASSGKINVDSRGMLKPNSTVPSGSTPHQQLVTDGEGNARWEDKVVVNSELSDTSPNPVQNKVIKSALDAKLEAPAETVSIETILPETTVTFDTDGEEKQSDVFINLEFGKEYTVIFDGVSYNARCIADQSAFLLGAPSGSFDKYPFMVLSYPDSGISVFIASTAGEHTFSISGEFEHADKIPGKFIADVLFVFREEA